ncbi:hypothetical protein N7470_002547 [Penicillium chermesinum]|nr:hypothetical protein N7470_002547 [Penicillium chermesinum]
MADNAELESFRREWREEVARRSKPRPTPPTTEAVPSGRVPPSQHEASHREDLEDEGPPPVSFDPEDLAHQVGELSIQPEAEHEDDGFTRRTVQEPKSALEHFERAVEKEAAGSLGDSLTHYRKAYRLDASVDKTYRDKHFAHVWKKTAQPAASVNSETTHATAPADKAGEMLPTPELLASFAHLPIPQAEPLVEDTPPPPCPISKVPSEVISEILRHVALRDPANFGRTALVCKNLAYHFAHEQQIWKEVCQGSKFGFGSMHYEFACDLHGHPIHTLQERYTPFPYGVPLEVPMPFSSWSQVFESYPRIRFTGIYISTVNYSRPGAQSGFHNLNWSSPIHIVTYYRYLRFYPDGSLVSLLTTTEPMDVVPHISTENMMAARAASHKQLQRRVEDPGHSISGATDAVPPVAMNALKYGFRGRWHLTRPFPESAPRTKERNQARISSKTPTKPRNILICET